VGNERWRCYLSAEIREWIILHRTLFVLFRLTLTSYLLLGVASADRLDISDGLINHSDLFTERVNIKVEFMDAILCNDQL
jgi:hypothetical protein